MASEGGIATALLSLTQKLSQPSPLEAKLKAVTDAALELLPCDHASIRLADASRTQLLSSARSGKGTDRGSLSIKKGEGVAGWVLEYGMPARIDDASKDPRFLEAVGQGFKIGAILAEPLLSGGNAIGVLSLSSSEVSAFTAEHELLARLLANCSVPPIEHARLERLAITDEKTLAYAARYLLPRLAEEIDRASSARAELSVMAIDLDRFAHVNASYGRPVGDRVLLATVERIRACARSFDIVVRSGDDDFVVVMPGVAGAAAREAAERVCKGLSESPMEPMQGGFITQTAAIGVATWAAGEDAPTLERRARAAMDSAKAAGGNRVQVA
jgi:diguanylate cyclase (GGDEF)-like protein